MNASTPAKTPPKGAAALAMAAPIAFADVLFAAAAALAPPAASAAFAWTAAWARTAEALAPLAAPFPLADPAARDAFLEDAPGRLPDPACRTGPFALPAPRAFAERRLARTALSRTPAAPENSSVPSSSSTAAFPIAAFAPIGARCPPRRPGCAAA